MKVGMPNDAPSTMGLQMVPGTLTKQCGVHLLMHASDNPHQTEVLRMLVAVKLHGWESVVPCSAALVSLRRVPKAPEI